MHIRTVYMLSMIVLGTGVSGLILLTRLQRSDLDIHLFFSLYPYLIFVLPTNWFDPSYRPLISFLCSSMWGLSHLAYLLLLASCWIRLHLQISQVTWIKFVAFSHNVILKREKRPVIYAQWNHHIKLPCLFTQKLALLSISDGASGSEEEV